MTAKLVLVCIAAVLALAIELAMVTVVNGECRWTGCHPHSASDWCDVLGPGYRIKDWQRCNGLLGKQEYCCN